MTDRFKILALHAGFVIGSFMAVVAFLKVSPNNNQKESNR